MSEPVPKAQGEPWEDPFSNKRPTRWFIGPILLLVFYVFSTGPMCLLQRKGHISDDVIIVVYAPIIFLCEKAGAVERFFDWYVCWWVGK